MSAREAELERQLEYLRRVGQPARRELPARRAPKGIEEYVEGRVDKNSHGEFFVARQALPFGRPYGKFRIGDLATAELHPLDLFLDGAALPSPSELVYLDTETTGLAGGTGTCAFLIGIAALEGTQFVVRQFFLRDYPEEKAMLAALSEALKPYRGLVTFNGKTFDVPLLETRFALARLCSPLGRLLHLDLLHPARRMWKLRLESCALTHLEEEILGIHRQGDVDGADIPGIYFDYLRTGDARGLQPVFFHNALDIVTLAALTLDVAQVIAGERSNNHGSKHSGTASSIDLFCLSRIFERAGDSEDSLSTCARALEAGLPSSIEIRALWQLAGQHKRRGEHERAKEIWLQISRRETPFAVSAFEELAIHFEHRRRDAETALRYAESALEKLEADQEGNSRARRIAHRLGRLRQKAAKARALPALQ